MSPFAGLFRKKRNDLLGKRQEEHEVLKDGAMLVQELIASCDGRDYYPIRIFSTNELIKAMVEEFHPHEKKLYYRCRGTYEGRQIFIKRYKREYIHRFMNEVVFVAQIYHRNAVKLLGCCFEMELPMVVYELLPNTLYDLLHKKNPSKQISWENRLRIGIEIADVVTYLHIAKPTPIIHRDIRSENILLDEHCRPKLCGFSLAIAIPLGKTHAKTNLIKSSLGHMDPEYSATGICTEKADVYSFGWLILEILSQKTPLQLQRTEKEVDGRKILITHEEVLEEVRRLSLISDNELPADARKVEQLMTCVELASRCIACKPDQRPTMKEVALKLRQIEKYQLPSSSSASSSPF